MREMQFTAIVLMSLLTLKLLLLPARTIVSPVMKRAWALMTAGTALIGLQFLLQYAFGLRELGVTQAVMLNLTLFIPCTWLLALALICLQQRGMVRTADIYVGVATWLAALGFMAFASFTDGEALLAGSAAMRRAEIAGSACFVAMMGYYMWRHYDNMRMLTRALNNYYDEDAGDLLRWMRLSSVILPVLGLMVPVMIFISGKALSFFGIAMFIAIFFLVDSFFNYVVSTAPAKVKEAEDHEDEEEAAQEENPRISQQHSPMHRVEIAVGQWVARGGHLKSGLKLPTVAEQLGVPRYLLTAWLRNRDLKYSDWMTDLRIEEAIRILKEHPDWSNEYVSQHCGFTDRTYFQRKFKEKTGISPSDYQSQQAK